MNDSQDVSITIEVVEGPLAGRPLRFESGPIPFGRHPENAVVIDFGHASRRHGRIEQDGGGWVLVNESANGTEVNGRRVTRKPVPLENGARVSIGGKPVMRVSLSAAPEPEPVAAGGEKATASRAAAGDERDEADSGGAGSGSGRGKAVYIGLGLWLLLIVGIGVGLSLSQPPEEASLEPKPQLTPDQIRSAIFRPPPSRPPDERQAAAAIEEARELYQIRDTRIDGLHAAWSTYRRALAYAGGTSFETGLDQRRFQDLETELAERLQDRYERAYGLLRSGRDREALAAFDRLAKFFPEQESEIYRHVLHQQRVALRRLKAQE